MRARALVVILALALAPRLAAADCEPSRLVERELTRRVVYLGDFADFLGHHASWFWDPVARVVVGPLDRDPWPGAKTHARVVPATTAARGASGTVKMSAWVTDAATTGAVSGWFLGFTPDGQQAPLDPIVAVIDRPYLVGLITGGWPRPNPGFDRMKLGPQRLDREVVALQVAGLLQAASASFVGEILPTYRLRDNGGANIEMIVAMRDGMTTLAAGPHSSTMFDWTDYLPDLATSGKSDLRDVLDDRMLGRNTPLLPPSDAPPIWRHSCGPTDAELRGPSIAGELTPEILLALLRSRDAKFAAHVVTAFTGVTAGSAYVVAMRRIDGKTVAIVTGQDDGLAGLVVTPAQAATLTLGTRIQYVARATLPSAVALPPLDVAASVIPLHVATRLRVDVVDAQATVDHLQHQAVSGRLPGAAGASLAMLFELADHLAGWTRGGARAYAWTLPGNVYDTPEQWAQAWHETLVAAVTDAPDLGVADELDRALPLVLARFATAPGGGRGGALPAMVVRDFAIEIEAAIALRRLAGGDRPGAQAAMARAAGPLATLAAPTPVGAETTLDPNHALIRVTIAALADALDKRPVTLPAESDRAHAMALVADLMRPYAPDVRARWVRALVAAGMPKPVE